MKLFWHFLDLTNFNTQNVFDMKSLFYDCISVKTINLSKFQTKNYSYMFYNCSSLNEINLSNFNNENVIYMNDVNDMFIIIEN